MTKCNGSTTQSDDRDVLSAVLAAFVAFWCLVALVAGLILHWPAIALGCLAAVVAAGTITSVVIFRIISRQHRC